MTLFNRVLTPQARTIFEFIQLVIYVGTATLIVYHFAVGHRDASAATLTPVVASAPASQQLASKVEVRAVSVKVDHALDAINDLRLDMTAVMDHLNISQDKRASGRHALPATYSNEVSP